MLPSFSFPPLEFCFGTSPIQAQQTAPRLERMRISDGRHERTRQRRLGIHQPATKLGLTRTRPNPAILLKDLFLTTLRCLEHAQT